ncbi:hypothetical protein PNO30_02060 [Gemella haemolysans]|uniref:Uncharacterized protein n=1 Tax=Gemella haemolysans TaxID=1379 RepID=A0AAW6B5W0_9BACL|nr:hypothetical protein [Gemella haemolysans]MDB6185559.1 hypothetical protein [Gemella haemolysans]
MSNNNSKPNNNNNNNNQNQNTNQNYSNYNQNDYNEQNSYNNQYQNYNNQGYQEGYNNQYQNYNEQSYQGSYNQQYQNYNNSNQQYQNNQQYDYSNQNYQTNNQYNYGNQQNNNQQYQNYSGSSNNQQYQNYNNANGQQGYNQQYQNYNNPGQYQQNTQNNGQFYQNNNRPNNSQGFDPNKKKKSKLVPIVSSILGIVLLSGGGLYYYSKSTNKPISSIFSFGKKSDEELYTPVLEKYKKAMDSGEVKSDSEVNNFAIENYNSKGKNKDYIRYVYYDIDGNGRNELLICDKDNLNSPFAIYSYDNSNKVNLIYQVESGNDISKSVFYNDKSIWIHDTTNNNDTYVVYKLKDDGSKFEKVHDINSAEYKKINKKFKDSISSEEFESKDEFFKKYAIPTDKIDFSKLGYKALYYYNDPNAQEEQKNSDKEKQENKPEFTNSQLALIGRALFYDSMDSLKSLRLDYDTGFTMSEHNGILATSLGTGGSIIQVVKNDTGIDIRVLDYDKPAAQRDFKVYKSVTYKEIKEKLSKEDIDKINKIIEEYKHTRNYEKGQFNIKD